MMNIMVPTVIVWLGMLLVGTVLAVLLLLRLSSRFRCHLYCPWCWQACHVLRYYPARWSSTICSYHACQILVAHERRRQLQHERSCV